VKFCIALAYNDTSELPALCRTAEECGFEAVILSDHLVYPASLRTPYPYTRDGLPRWQPDTPWPDPFVSVGALSMVTERLRFIISVFVLPLRHPAQAAKSIATASVLSNDRLVLGVGAGWMREEFELVGQRFENRGRRTAEALEVMRKLWTGEAVEHRGEFYRFEAVQMSPVPRLPVPVWGGGHADAALRRAAQLCDGWLSEIQKSDEMPAIVKRLRELRADSSRSEVPFSICAAVSDAVGVDAYRRLAGLGVTHIITVPWLFYGQPRALEEKCDGIRRFADEVLSLVGAASDG
jgi:probable F420-dependent oxidoreductase